MNNRLLVRYIEDCKNRDEISFAVLLDFVKHLEQWGYNTPPLRYVTDKLKKSSHTAKEVASDRVAQI